MRILTATLLLSLAASLTGCIFVPVVKAVPVKPRKHECDDRHCDVHNHQQRHCEPEDTED